MNFSIEQSLIGNFIILILIYARPPIRTVVTNPMISRFGFVAETSYLTRCSVFKDQTSLAIVEVLIGDNFYIITCPTVLCKLFLKSFFEALLASNSSMLFIPFRGRNIMFSWPELEYTMYRNIMQPFLKKTK